jgi:hypothetical protein
LLGFSDVSSDKISDGLFKHVQQVISDLVCVKKIIGQTYSGASGMKGHVIVLQKKIMISQCIVDTLLCSFHKFSSAELCNIEGEKKFKIEVFFVNFF